jgi:hypothetical protein
MPSLIEPGIFSQASSCGMCGKKGIIEYSKINPSLETKFGKSSTKM